MKRLLHMVSTARLKRRSRSLPGVEPLEPRTLFTISVTFSTYNLLGSTASDTLATNGWVGVLITAVSDASPIGGFDLDSNGGGIYGTFTQQTTLTNGTASTPYGAIPMSAPGSAADLSDSFFSNFSTGNVSFLQFTPLDENNNGNSHPATTLQTYSGDYSYVPLADTSAINYGIGSRLHGIGGFTHSTANSIPLAFVIAPRGSTVHVVGQFSDNAESAQKFPVDQSFTVPTPPDTIATSTFFYNDSAYDGNNIGINTSDDNAVALDKTALLPGHTATFANYTSYDKGINGIVFDMTSLPGTLSAGDFTFKIGGVAGDTNPANWVAAPAPSAIMARPGAGIGGSTRLEITWADGAIQNRWLQVTVKADANTGLAANTTFYFGNAIGETGDSPTYAYVSAIDEIGARYNPADLTVQPLATAITNIYDFNRDRQVNAADVSIAGAHYTNFTNALAMLAAPAVPAAEPLAALPGIDNTLITTPLPVSTPAPAPVTPPDDTVTTTLTVPAPNGAALPVADAVNPLPSRHWYRAVRRRLFERLNFLVRLGNH